MLQGESFFNLTALEVLSLSHNPLKTVPNTLLGFSPNIQFVSLRNVSSTHFHNDVFQGLNTARIEATDFHFCCITPAQTNCMVTVPWYMPCRRLLPGDLIRVYHQVLLVSMLLLNSVSVLVNCFVSDSTKSYLSTVVSVILTHMLFLLYLCAIWIADIHFKETFLLKEELWRSSVGCLGAFHLVFWFSIQIQFALIFLSLSRLMVVIHPLDTRFKRTKFAVNAISIVCTMSFCFCILTTLIAQFSIVALPNVLCLPFNDPTQSEVITRTMTYSVSATQSATSIAIVVMHCLLVKYFHESQHNIQRS